MKAHGTRRCSVRFLVFYSCFLVVTTKAICDVALEKEEKHSSNEHNETKVNLSNSQSRIAFRILYKPFSKKEKAKQKRADSHLKKDFFPLKKEKSHSKTVFCWASNWFPPCSRFSSAVQQIAKSDRQLTKRNAKNENRDEKGKIRKKKAKICRK